MINKTAVENAREYDRRKGGTTIPLKDLILPAEVPTYRPRKSMGKLRAEGWEPKPKKVIPARGNRRKRLLLLKPTELSEY